MFHWFQRRRFCFNIFIGSTKLYNIFCVVFFFFLNIYWDNVTSCCGVLLLLFCVQHMADAIHTADQTGKNFYHVTQFHPITVNHICFRYISCHIDNKTFVYNNNIYDTPLFTCWIMHPYDYTS
jgi:hypothetical protein